VDVPGEADGRAARLLYRGLLPLALGAFAPVPVLASMGARMVAPMAVAVPMPVGVRAIMAMIVPAPAALAVLMAFSVAVPVALPLHFIIP
jgi:hypothetical protein